MDNRYFLSAINLKKTLRRSDGFYFYICKQDLDTDEPFDTLKLAEKQGQKADKEHGYRYFNIRHHHEMATYDALQLITIGKNAL